MPDNNLIPAKEPLPAAIECRSSIANRILRVLAEEVRRSEIDSESNAEAAVAATRPGLDPAEREISEPERFFAEIENCLGTITKENPGLDPEIFRDLCVVAGFHIEAGARKFPDFARIMVAELGDFVRPLLKLSYNTVRDFPGDFFPGMTPREEVMATDVTGNFGGPEIGTRESEIERLLARAEQ
jgi:hypothetical protein